MEILEEGNANWHPYKRYNWDAWMDGKVRVATKGEDFVCETDSFQLQLQMQGRKRGVKVKTRKVRDNSVQFQFLVEERLEQSNNADEPVPLDDLNKFDVGRSDLEGDVSRFPEPKTKKDYPPIETVPMPGTHKLSDD